MLTIDLNKVLNKSLYQATIKICLFLAPDRPLENFETGNIYLGVLVKSFKKN